MKILIDINHPAYAHYFRKFINRLEKKRHFFIVTNSDDKLINYLLDRYGISHTFRNS
jgi:predicted glycosyltransferase